MLNIQAELISTKKLKKVVYHGVSNSVMKAEMVNVLCTR